MEFRPSELILIRHGESASEGRLCGRTDVDLADAAMPALANLAGLLPGVERVVVSPAKRCKQTAERLWPTAALVEDPLLWEQDFGAWDGLPYNDLPDVGDLTRAELARFAAPKGESFADLCARVHPALMKLAAETVDEPVIVVAHAGIVRAGISLALGDLSAGLGFVVDPLSLTRLTCHPKGTFAVSCVNWRPGG
ncbi:MAG: histidine phosphatase family protein [Silicimonas sp.]|nr:histidine phosphatase family protein [Silicimonas sp.]